MQKTQEFETHLQRSKKSADVLYSTQNDIIAKRAYEKFKKEEEILNLLLGHINHNKDDCCNLRIINDTKTSQN